MTGVYKRYFKVTSGKILDELRRINQINIKARGEYREILRSIGARDTEFHHIGQRLTGIIFDKAPDSKLFKSKRNGGYYPKKNIKEGRELASRLQSVETCSELNALSTVGLPCGMAMIKDNMVYGISITKIPINDPSTVYVCVPWYDEDPEVLSKYKDENKRGDWMDMNLDLLIWEPPEYFEEVKRWEVEKHIDEYNESIK